MGWDAKQNSYKRNDSESNGDLVNISCTRPLGAECLVFGVTLVFYAQGEFAAIIWTISHFTMRTWTRDTCDSEFAETGKTVFPGCLGVEDFRWFNHKPMWMKWRLKRSEGRYEYAPVLPPGRNDILQAIWTWLFERYNTTKSSLTSTRIAETSKNVTTYDVFRILKGVRRYGRQTG